MHIHIIQNVYGFCTDEELEHWLELYNSPIRPSFSPITPPPLPRLSKKYVCKFHYLFTVFHIAIHSPQ